MKTVVAFGGRYARMEGFRRIPYKLVVSEARSGTVSGMLEEFIASINSNVFLREFSFSENTFRPSPGEEVEFADHVIWVDDLLMLYQLKERAKLTGMSPEGERRWFRKKVLKEATKQVRDTLRYLETQPEISITNQRGHRINVGGSAPSRTVKVVVYAASEMLPDDCCGSGITGAPRAGSCTSLARPITSEFVGR